MYGHKSMRKAVSGVGSVKRVVYTVDTEIQGPNSEKGVYDYLDLFNELGIKGTFFVTGQFAREHPSLVNLIFTSGHEVGSHFDVHLDVSLEKTKWDPLVEELSVEQVATCFQRSIDDLISAGVKKPLGFRAPRFRIKQEQLNLVPQYFCYDSSLWHGRTDLTVPSNFHELWISSVKFFNLRLGTPLLFLPFGSLLFKYFLDLKHNTPLVIYGHSFDFIKIDYKLYNPLWRQFAYMRRCGPHQLPKVRSFIKAMMGRGYQFTTARDILF